MLTRRPALVGAFLIAHGLAHSTVGFLADGAEGFVRAVTPARGLGASVVFAFALTGFVQAGLGTWGVPGLRRIWRPLLRLAVLASIVSLVLFVAPSLRLMVGLFLDAVALALADAPLRATVVTAHVQDANSHR